MALKSCRECRKEIGGSSIRCPHYGKYVWTRVKMGYALVTAVIVTGFIMGFLEAI